VLPLLQESLRNADANVRRLGIEACLALPTPERIALVAALLDDPHPDLRRRVRDGVFQLAHRPELDVAVREAGLRVLGQDGWRGQEQAALLLGALDHEPAAGRLLERLEATRGEVAIAAAWALKALAIPETLPDVLVDVTRRTDARIQAPPPFPVFDEQVAHLLELLGELRYAPAEPLLRRHVPKNFSYGLLSRGAAIWGLGLLHEGQPDEELAAQLNERLHDLDPFNPEAPLVRQMSAITIGRMKAASQMASLRTLLGPVVGVDPVSFAIRWAILNTTGEALPIPDKVVQYRTDWFLQPLGDTESGEP
jgi:HEAT repeat protein